jgi:hypothetical protein
MKKNSILTLIFTLVFGPLMSQNASETDLSLIRNALQSERRTLVAENMNLVTEEEKIFWDIYDQYEIEHGAILKQEFSILKEYLEKYETLSEEEASKLMEQAFVLERKDQKIRKKYYNKLKKNLSVTHAVRFTQIERQLKTFMRVMIYQETPLLDYK